MFNVFVTCSSLKEKKRKNPINTFLKKKKEKKDALHQSGNHGNDHNELFREHDCL